MAAYDCFRGSVAKLRIRLVYFMCTEPSVLSLLQTVVGPGQYPTYTERVWSLKFGLESETLPVHQSRSRLRLQTGDVRGGIRKL